MNTCAPATCLLCLLAGMGVGAWLPSSSQKQSVDVVARTVPRQSKAAGPLPVPRTDQASEAALPAVPPPGLEPYQLQDWMRDRWDEERPEVAFAAFLAVSDLATRQGLAESFAGGGAHYDPGLIAQLILSLPPDKVANRALGKLIQEWSEADAEEAFRFLTTIPVQRLTADAFSWISLHFASLPPERVVAFASKLSPALQIRFLRPVFSNTGSWERTCLWLDQVPAQVRQTVMSESMFGRDLALFTPEQAQAWMAQQDPVTQARLQASLAATVASHDRKAGLELLAKVSAGPERAASANNIVSQWLLTDRPAAIEWLHSAAAATMMKPPERAWLLRINGLEEASP